MVTMDAANGRWLDYFIQHGDEIVVSQSELALAREGVWIMAGICSAVVGLSGLLPVVLLAPRNPPTRAEGNTAATVAQKEDSLAESPFLKLMLSFAVGSLLGDVFLHLLPDACTRLHEQVERDPTLSNAEVAAKLRHGHFTIGLWIVVGLLTFIFVELVFNVDGSKGSNNNGRVSVTGYLNLVANCVDNFSHGLAVGGAFLVSVKVGLVTTACILLHEIPHEVGDFAILLKSGFTRYEAAKAQFSTAGLGMLGAFFALALDSMVAVDCITAWIVPFTCGGFLNIALVTVLPDLLHSRTVGECLTTFVGIFLGLAAMMSLSQF